MTDEKVCAHEKREYDGPVFEGIADGAPYTGQRPCYRESCVKCGTVTGTLGADLYPAKYSESKFSVKHGDFVLPRG